MDNKLEEFFELYTIPEFYFLLIGLDLFKQNSKPERYYVKFTYFWIQYWFFYVLGYGEVVTFYYECKGSKSFLKIIEQLSYFGFIFLCILKLTSFLIFRSKLRAIMHELHNLFPKTNEYHNINSVVKHTKRILFLTKLLSRFFIIFILTFCILPFIETILRYRKTGVWVREFPYPVWYPFNAYAKGVFEINYIIQVLCSINGVAGYVAVDTLFIVLVLNICMEFEIFHRDIQNINTGRGTNDFQQLRDCIMKHQQLIRLSNEIDTSSSFSMFCNFLASTCIICMAGFTTMTNPQANVLLKFILFLISSLIEIFTLCWCGDKLKEYVSRFYYFRYISIFDQTNYFNRVQIL